MALLTFRADAEKARLWTRATENMLMGYEQGRRQRKTRLDAGLGKCYSADNGQGEILLNWEKVDLSPIQNAGPCACRHSIFRRPAGGLESGTAG